VNRLDVGKTPKERYQDIQAYAKYSGIGLQMAISLGVPIACGLWLDQRYATTPWALLAGIAFGMLAIFSVLFKLARESTRKP
jgi:F0F1-type ATP synthase assembly protein I